MVVHSCNETQLLKHLKCGRVWKTSQFTPLFNISLGRPRSSLHCSIYPLEDLAVHSTVQHTSWKTSQFTPLFNIPLGRPHSSLHCSTYPTCACLHNPTNIHLSWRGFTTAKWLPLQIYGLSTYTRTYTHPLWTGFTCHEFVCFQQTQWTLKFSGAF